MSNKNECHSYKVILRHVRDGEQRNVIFSASSQKKAEKMALEKSGRADYRVSMSYALD